MGYVLNIVRYLKNHVLYLVQVFIFYPWGGSKIKMLSDGQESRHFFCSHGSITNKQMSPVKAQLNRESVISGTCHALIGHQFLIGKITKISYLGMNYEGVVLGYSCLALKLSNIML